MQRRSLAKRRVSAQDAGAVWDLTLEEVLDDLDPGWRAWDADEAAEPMLASVPAA